jgi:hypothetical protein
VASESVIAAHADHQWHLEGERYSRLDATTPVRIHFERPQPYPRAPVSSRRFGPYQRFSAMDGVAYTDDRLFAFVDPKVGDWFCYEDGQHWSLMVVSDATSAGKNGLWAALAGLAPHLPGVIGLWSGLTLRYLGRATSIRARLEALGRVLDTSLFTGIAWESHPDPAAREAQLLAEETRGQAAMLRCKIRPAA